MPGPRAHDHRVCFFGDSFTAGVGDSTARGWVGRSIARARAEGHALTGYNLGVRRDTGRDVARRWEAEAKTRLRHGDRFGIVLAVGVNDTKLVDGRRRASAAQTVACVRLIAAKAAGLGWSAMVVGPTPVADQTRNPSIHSLSTDLADSCLAVGTPYVDLTAVLLGDDAWMDEVAGEDGAHPAAAGYARMAELIFPTFTSWLSDGPASGTGADVSAQDRHD